MKGSREKETLKETKDVYKRIMRGDIFMVKLSGGDPESLARLTYPILGKKRPCLIISDDEYNTKPGRLVFTVLPIKTWHDDTNVENEVVMPINMQSDRDSLICISQIRSVSLFDFGDYMSTCTPEFMEELDKEIDVFMGLRNMRVRQNDLSYNVLTNLQSENEELKEQIRLYENSNNNSSTIPGLSPEINQAIDIAMTAAKTQEKENKPKRAYNKKTKTILKSNESLTPTKVKSWTLDEMMGYIDYRSTHTLKETMNHYNIVSSGSQHYIHKHCAAQIDKATKPTGSLINMPSKNSKEILGLLEG